MVLSSFLGSVYYFLGSVYLELMSSNWTPQVEFCLEIIRLEAVSITINPMFRDCVGSQRIDHDEALNIIFACLVVSIFYINSNAWNVKRREFVDRAGRKYPQCKTYINEVLKDIHTDPWIVGVIEKNKPDNKIHALTLLIFNWCIRRICNDLPVMILNRRYSGVSVMMKKCAFDLADHFPR